MEFLEKRKTIMSSDWECSFYCKDTFALEFFCLVLSEQESKLSFKVHQFYEKLFELKEFIKNNRLI